MFSRTLPVSLFLGASLICLFEASCKKALPQISQTANAYGVAPPINMVIWTDRAKYSLRDSVEVNALLQNHGDSTVYVARSMYWHGYGNGLKLEIRNEKGEALPAELFSDAPIPPPKEGDTTFFVPLDSGFSYGTWVGFLVKDFLPRPGRYSIRVIYYYWLPKEFVPLQFRDLPVLGADTTAIVSQPVWIEVTQ